MAKCSKCASGVCEAPKVEPPKSPCPEVCEIPTGGECSFHPEFPKRQHHVNLCRHPKKRYRQYWDWVYGGGEPTKKIRKKRVPRRKSVDAKEWFTLRYTRIRHNFPDGPSLAELLAKVDRCRAADCGHLVDDVCSRGQWSACRLHLHWFSLLMYEDCNLWPAS